MEEVKQFKRSVINNPRYYHSETVKAVMLAGEDKLKDIYDSMVSERKYIVEKMTKDYDEK